MLGLLGSSRVLFRGTVQCLNGRSAGKFPLPGIDLYPFSEMFMKTRMIDIFQRYLILMP
jgi:hypothetical protein